jgi:hypothetical protein
MDGLDRYEPLQYLNRPGFFAHLWRDADATNGWRAHGPQLSMLTEEVEEARAEGNASRLEDTIAAREDLCRELGSKYGNPLRQRCYPTDLLVPLLAARIDPGTDNYISQGIFGRPTRRLVHLRTLTSLFGDLDFYKTEMYGRRSPDFVAQAPTIACADNAIPPPTTIIDSGRGLQAKWRLDRPLPARALPRWRAVQRELVNRLGEFGADPKACAGNQVLRLPTTINTKTGRLVQILDYDSRRLYDFEILCDELLPFSREQIAQFRAEQELRHKEQPQRKSSPGMHRWGPQTLAWDRFQDLQRLAEIRGWDSTGYPTACAMFFFCGP